MRWLVLALVLLLFAPSVSACTTGFTPELRVSLVIDRGDERLHNLDTRMRYTENVCSRLFWVSLFFEGRFAAWRDSSVVTIVNTSTGQVEPSEASSNWSLGQGLIIDLDGDLRIRNLTTGTASHVSAQNQSRCYMVDGSLAMAAVENGAGMADPYTGFHIYDAIAGDWILDDVRPRSHGWPAGISQWLGCSSSWVLFETEGGLYAYDVEGNRVNGPLPEADGPGGSDSSDRQTSPTGLIDLTGLQASFRREYHVGYYTDRFWRIDLVNETFVDKDRIPAAPGTGRGRAAHRDHVSALAGNCQDCQNSASRGSTQKQLPIRAPFGGR